MQAGSENLSFFSVLGLNKMSTIKIQHEDVSVKEGIIFFVFPVEKFILK
jgi:hypothetical protein